MLSEPSPWVWSAASVLTSPVGAANGARETVWSSWTCSLADVFVECESCKGRRYNRETLEVNFRGRNIAEVLDMTVSEAIDAFWQASFHPLQVGNSGCGRTWLPALGQAANTLSGGEAQRLKLSLELSRKQTGKALYLLDEPTTGLHWLDGGRLMDLLFKLRDAGNTLVVIEHNLDVRSFG